MARITIKDLRDNVKVNNEEMARILGGTVGQRGAIVINPSEPILHFGERGQTLWEARASAFEFEEN